MIKNFKELVAYVANLEAGKSEAKVGDIRSALTHVSDLIEEDAEVALILKKNGARRAKAKKAKK